MAEAPENTDKPAPRKGGRFGAKQPGTPFAIDEARSRLIRVYILTGNATAAGKAAWPNLGSDRAARTKAFAKRDRGELSTTARAGECRQSAPK